MDTIGFIGGGNMAEAIIKGIIASSQYSPDNILVSDIATDRLEFLKDAYAIQLTKDNNTLVDNTQVIVLSVKPQQFPDVLSEIKDNISDDKLIVSIAAGITTSKIENSLGDIPIVRVMPNTPALIGEGAAALFANDKAKAKLDTALAIFSSIGIAVVVEDEDLIDAVTALSGSGPAYFFLLMQEMIKTAKELGLSDDIAKDLVLQTAKGSALLAAESSDTPTELRKKVTSPGGTTQAAMEVFADMGFAELINAALKKARDRSIELSK